jgi:glycosyltransferase involved in cell wall biosynthesis
MAAALEPKVTVAIPTYNRSRLLAQALSSLVDQGLRREEYRVAISDNASSDDTQEIIEGFRNRLEIDYRRNQQNIGPRLNWHQVIDMCQAPLFSFLSDDDLLAPGQLARALRIFATEPNVSLVASVAVCQPHPGAFSSEVYGMFLSATSETPFNRTYQWKACEWLALALINTPLSLIGSVFQRDAFLRCGEEWKQYEIWADRLFMAQMAIQGDVFSLPWIGGHYRTHVAQLNSQNMRLNQEEFHRVTQAILKICAERELPIRKFWADHLSHVAVYERDHYLRRLKFALPRSMYKDIRHEAAKRVGMGFMRGIVLEPPAGLGSQIFRRLLRSRLSRSPEFPPGP